MQTRVVERTRPGIVALVLPVAALVVLAACSQNPPARTGGEAKQAVGEQEGTGTKEETVQTPPPPSPEEPPKTDQAAAGEVKTEGAPEPKSPEPPDGKWLVDELGRQYFVEKLPKIEGEYRWVDENRIRVRYGLIYDVADHDDEFFYVKLYKVAPVEPPATLRKPTEAEIAAVEASYAMTAPVSNRLSFLPFDQGLPRSGQWRNGFDLADMNGDGHLDIVHGPPRKGGIGPVIFLGDGAGNWRLWEEARFPDLPYDYGDVAVADFNGDGHPDLALAIHLRGLLVLVNDGRGGFEPWSQGLELWAGAPGEARVEVFSSRAIVAVDWNRDGRPDLLAINEGPVRPDRVTLAAVMEQEGSAVPSVAAFLNAGDGRWTRRAPEGDDRVEVFGDDLAVGDFNGDGLLDFVTASHVGAQRRIVNLGRPDGTWVAIPVEDLRRSVYVWSVAAADLDGDGRDDLAVGYSSLELQRWWNGIDIFYSRPGEAGLAGKRKTLWVGEEHQRQSAHSLGFGDLDGDGALDLVAGLDDGTLRVFLGDGKGFFTRESAPELETAEEACRAYHVRLADLDGDGTDEIAAAFAGEPGGEKLLLGLIPERCPSQGSLRVWKAAASDLSGGQTGRADSR